MWRRVWAVWSDGREETLHPHSAFLRCGHSSDGAAEALHYEYISAVHREVATPPHRDARRVLRARQQHRRPCTPPRRRQPLPRLTVSNPGNGVHHASTSSTQVKRVLSLVPSRQVTNSTHTPTVTRLCPSSLPPVWDARANRDRASKRAPPERRPPVPRVVRRTAKRLRLETET